MMPEPRARSRIGKYRLLRRLGDGGFATVWEALDTVLGLRVALKVLGAGPVTRETLQDFRKQVRLQAQLDHPSILPVNNADVLDGRMVVVHPLGEQSLADRMHYRIGTTTFLDFAAQMLAAVAYAHGRGIIHCDLKPENFILFEGGRLRLSDFGISRIARRTVRGSGSGTVGYIAPEQAMGRTSFRSDVFSLGLILYELLTGHLPEWPFEWPFEGRDKLRRRVPEDFVRFLRKALAVHPRARWADARTMHTAFDRLRPKVETFLRRQKQRRTRRRR